MEKAKVVTMGTAAFSVYGCFGLLRIHQQHRNPAIKKYRLAPGCEAGQKSLKKSWHISKKIRIVYNMVFAVTPY